MHVLAVDVGGTHVKVLVTGESVERKVDSGPSMTAAVMVGACSSPPEQPILYQFFTASRLRDSTSLQNFAVVSWSWVYSALSTRSFM